MFAEFGDQVSRKRRAEAARCSSCGFWLFQMIPHLIPSRPPRAQPIVMLRANLVGNMHHRDRLGLMGVERANDTKRIATAASNEIAARGTNS